MLSLLASSKSYSISTIEWDTILIQILEYRLLLLDFNDSIVRLAVSVILAFFLEATFF